MVCVKTSSAQMVQLCADMKRIGISCTPSESLDDIMLINPDKSAVPLFVRDWTGKTKILNSRASSFEELQHEIFQQWSLPCAEQNISSSSPEMQKMLLTRLAFSPIPFTTFYLSIKCAGGKGGFGAMLRGQQSRPGLKKVAPNTGAMRDLSGRRLRHVEQEQKLAEWVSNAEKRRAEKESEKKEKRQKRWEETHDAAEKYVAVAKVDVAEISDAVRQGLEEDRRHKERLIQQEKEKRAKIEKSVSDLDKLLGADSDSSSSGEDESSAESKKVSAVIQVSAADSVALSNGTPTQKSAEAASDNSKPTDNTRKPATVADKKEPNRIQPLEKQQQSNGSQPAEAAGPGTMSSQAAPAPSTSGSVPATADGAGGASANLPDIDLEGTESIEALVAMGGDRLKAALAACGLKCGGTVQQRAERLWSVRGLPRAQWPAAALAPPAGSGNGKASNGGGKQ